MPAFLPTSVAILATSLLDAIPMELGKPKSSRISTWSSSRKELRGLAHAGDVQKGLVNGDLLETGGDVPQAPHHLFRHFPVHAVPPRHDLRGRVQPHSLRHGHPGPNSELASGV